MNNLLAIESAEDLLNIIKKWLSDTGIKILVAIIVAVIGFALINILVGWIKKINEKRNFDKTLGRALRKIIGYGLKILLIMMLLAYLGVEISGITALITSLGVTVGLAIQGALANVAGGILIIISRPFVLDDFIEAQGVKGTIEDIRLLYTKLRTPDNKIVSLPNGALANGTIINYSAKTTRRVDIDFTIAYSDDYKKAQEIILRVAKDNKLVLKDPEPICRISAHGESSIVLTTKIWVKTEDYWTVYFDMHEAVKTAFDSEGIHIPFNQLDVHIVENKGE